MVALSTTPSKPRLTVELPSDREIVLVREFDAPRHLVFEAFTKPEHLVHWWGRVGSTVRVDALELRPGGAWRFVTREPDGQEDAFRGQILEVTPPERFTWTFEYEGALGHICEETATFEEHDGRTTVRAWSRYPSREERDAMLQAGMELGARESYDRLAAYLPSLSGTADREVVQRRLIKAPRDLVFRAFTDPQHVDHWWGPRGFTTTTHSMDVRPGGSWRFDMHMENGPTFPNLVVYREVVPPERLVYQHGSGSDDDDVFEVTVTLVDRDDLTELTMRQVFASAAELERVIREVNAVELGKQTLDRLEEWLARA